MDLRDVRGRVRGQGADLPTAHVAARRPHRGPDRRLGDPGRRHAQARHLRVPAVRAVPVPRGGALLGRTGAPHPRGDRHHLRRDRRHDAEGPQAAGRVLVGGPTWASSCSARSPSTARVITGGLLADGQPRRVDRCPVPAGRLDLRAPPHPPDRRARRPAEGGAGHGRVLHAWSCSARSASPGSMASLASS